MLTYSSWRDIPLPARGACVVLGNFDGVHRGHAHLIRAGHAARPDLALAALTFEPHPRELFRPDDPPFHLTLPGVRARELGHQGISIVYELPFDLEFSGMPALAFIDDVLASGIGAQHLVCGLDYAFGYRRGGTMSLLAERAQALGIGLTIVPPLADAAGPLSSSRIRRALQDGYPERAADMLGRPWEIVGEVGYGDQRGRTIGFPTANIQLGRHVEPARGVYAVIVTLPDGRQFPGAANIGRRPTVNAGPESRLEVNLFGFSENLYGLELRVALHAYLRGERKFAGLEALQAQITADCLEARRILDLRQ